MKMTGHFTSDVGMFFCALRADSFDDIVCLVGDEAFRDMDGRNGVFAEAIGLPAFLAEKVAVCFLRTAMSVVVAQAVLVKSASVVDAMDEMPLVEERKSPEYDGLVDALQFIFKRGKAEGVAFLVDGVIYKEAGGGRANACVFQNRNIIFSFHSVKKRCLSTAKISISFCNPVVCCRFISFPVPLSCRVLVRGCRRTCIAGRPDSGPE